MALAAAWFWRCYRLRVPLGVWDRWDGLICALSGGFIVSSLHVVIAGGQKRTALTMLWEWIGLAVAMLLCRRWFRDRSARQSLIVSLASLVVALAGLGVWQHHVWYANLGELFTEYESLSSRSGLTSTEEQRLRELQGELGADVAILETTGRASLRNRVLNSTEPVGRFALANSFAAILLFGLIVSAALAASASSERRDKLTLMTMIAVLVFLGYVLLLTKSRSALIGLIASVVLTGGCLVGRRSGGRSARILVVASAAAATLFAITWLTGGLDRLVLSEAGKSFSYRLEFWKGTSSVIRENPWLGTGPGNFRQHYLRYKLPGASEEILDPHNLFLEAWAVGGIVPLLALVGILVGVGWSVVLKRKEPFRHESPNSNIVLMGVLATGLVPFLGRGILTSTWDVQLATLTCGALLAAVVWLWWNRSKKLLAFDHPIVLGAVLTGLIVHLLVSGGMGMPGIVQLMMLACLFGVEGPRRVAAQSSTISEKACLGAAIVMAVGVVVLVWTGLVPASAATTLVQAGDVESLRQRSSSKAMEYYTEACEADPLDPIPWSRRGALLMSRWESARSNRDQLLDEAAAFQQEAISRDPWNPRLKHELGSWYWQAFRTDQNESHLSAAIDWLSLGVEGYPNSCLFQGTLAFALDAAGEVQAAKAHAAWAIELDRLNRTAGHTDKLLPEPVHQELLILTGENEGTSEGD